MYGKVEREGGGGGGGFAEREGVWGGGDTIFLLNIFSFREVM